MEVITSANSVTWARHIYISERENVKEHYYYTTASNKESTPILDLSFPLFFYSFCVGNRTVSQWYDNNDKKNGWLP